MKKILCASFVLLSVSPWYLIGAQLERKDSCASFHTARSNYSAEDISSLEGEGSNPVHFSWRHVRAYQRAYEQVQQGYDRANQEGNFVDWTKYGISSSSKKTESLDVMLGQEVKTEYSQAKSLYSVPLAMVSQSEYPLAPSVSVVTDYPEQDNSARREAERLQRLRENFIKAQEQEPKSLFSKIMQHPYRAIAACTGIITACVCAFSWFSRR